MTRCERREKAMCDREREINERFDDLVEYAISGAAWFVAMVIVGAATVVAVWLW
jgi:hypothetical protein